MEYLENKLDKRYANLCTKIIMLKKIKEDSTTNEVCLDHGGKPHIVKLPILLKLIYEFNLIPIKISVCFFLGKNFQREFTKFIPKLTMLTVTKANVKIRTKSEG